MNIHFAIKGYSQNREKIDNSIFFEVESCALRREGLADFSDAVKAKVPMSYKTAPDADCGSYLLILKLENDRRIFIGRLGESYFRRGFYIYAGSAMKNLSRRIERHKAKEKKRHWHIDYLREHAEFHACYAIRSSNRLECETAHALSRLTSIDVPGFGSSDCSCRSHLFYTKSDPLHSKEFNKLISHFKALECPPAAC